MVFPVVNVNDHYNTKSENVKYKMNQNVKNIYCTIIWPTRGVLDLRYMISFYAVAFPDVYKYIKEYLINELQR